MEPIYYGLDLSWDMVQISRFNIRTGEPESVGTSGGQQELLMPAMLCRRREIREWLAGQEALRLSAKGGGILIGNLLAKLLAKEDTEVDGEVYSAADLMEIYLSRLLELLQRCYGTREITRIAVTLPDKAFIPEIKQQLIGIFNRLGIQEDACLLLSHAQCLMYYCVNTQQILWMNGAGLISCDEESFLFEQLSCSMQVQPIVMQAECTDLSDEYHSCDISSQTDERKAFWFRDTVEQLLRGRTIPTLFVTGTGFAGGWADDALRKLCNGRRVFYGQNLFTKGACQAARMTHEGSAREYLFLSGDMIRESIFLKMYRDSAQEYVELAHVGTDYHDVDCKLRIILDGTKELEFLVQNAKKREPVHEVMILEHPMKKENKTTRLELTLKYLDCHSPVVQLRDMGFAGTKSSRRIWEQLL